MVDGQMQILPLRTKTLEDERQEHAVNEGNECHRKGRNRLEVDMTGCQHEG